MTFGDYGFGKTPVYSFFLAFNLFTLDKDQNLTFFSIISLFLTSVEVDDLQINTCNSRCERASFALILCLRSTKFKICLF